jgi:signal peptide peptidase SppA
MLKLDETSWLGRRFARRTIVPAVRLSGVVGRLPARGSGMTLAGLERALDAAFSLKKAPAVALVVNSPGGSPVQSSLIATRIRALAREREKPVLAFVEDVAASGGYWLALAADEVFVDASSIVGSIGVVSAGFGFQDAIARLGVERRVHTGGEHKAMLDPFRPERDGDVAILKGIQSEIHERFKAWVRERRGARLKGEGADIFDGRVWTGARALELGLVDGIGDARSILRERYGKRVALRVMNRERGWLARRFGMGYGPRELAGETLSLLDELWHRQRLGL